MPGSLCQSGSVAAHLADLHACKMLHVLMVYCYWTAVHMPCKICAAWEAASLQRQCWRQKASGYAPVMASHAAANLALLLSGNCLDVAVYCSVCAARRY